MRESCGPNTSLTRRIKDDFYSPQAIQFSLISGVMQYVFRLRHLDPFAEAFVFERVRTRSRHMR